MARLIRICNQNNVLQSSSCFGLNFKRLSTFISKQSKNEEVIVDKLKDKQSGIAVSFSRFHACFLYLI